MPEMRHVLCWTRYLDSHADLFICLGGQFPPIACQSLFPHAFRVRLLFSPLDLTTTRNVQLSKGRGPSPHLFCHLQCPLPPISPMRTKRPSQSSRSCCTYAKMASGCKSREPTPCLIIEAPIDVNSRPLGFRSRLFSKPFLSDIWSASMAMSTSWPFQWPSHLQLLSP